MSIDLDRIVCPGCGWNAPKDWQGDTCRTCGWEAQSSHCMLTLREHLTDSVRVTDIVDLGAFLRGVLGEQPPASPPQGTVRVRVYCLVAPDGAYNAAGYDDRDSWVFDPDNRVDEKWLHSSVAPVGGSDCHGVWVEADVPLPAVPTVEGRVCE